MYTLAMCILASFVSRSLFLSLERKTQKRPGDEGMRVFTDLYYYVGLVKGNHNF